MPDASGEPPLLVTVKVTVPWSQVPLAVTDGGRVPVGVRVNVGVLLGVKVNVDVGLGVSVRVGVLVGVAIQFVPKLTVVSVVLSKTVNVIVPLAPEPDTRADWPEVKVTEPVDRVLPPPVIV